MRYQYNFGFLAEWLEANQTIPKNAIQRALGVKSNNGIKEWTQRKRPMPMISMLRLCNSFNIPLSAFFRDADAEEQQTVIPLPNINDQLEPDGGFDYKESERQQGERTILDPLDVIVMPSVVPGTEHLSARPATEVPKENEKNGKDLTDSILHTIVNLELEHKNQINKMLGIIAEQQKQIADMNTQIAELKGIEMHPATTYNYQERDVPFAAEPTREP